MNHYAQGGQAQGLGNLNDTYSRGVQYKDGVPSFGIGGSLRKAWKGTVGKVEDIAKPITEPITDAIKPILPYVQYIAPFIPGVNMAMAVGLGALSSGFAGGGGFNLKRGIMGGITAYGMSNLARGLQAAAGPGAGTTAATGAEVAAPSVTDVAGSLGVEGAATGAGSQSAMLAEQAAGFGDAGLSNIASSASYAEPATRLGLAGTDAVASQVARTGLAEPTMADMPFMDRAGAALRGAGSSISNQASTYGQGIKNLTGLGDTTLGIKDAAGAFGKEFGMGSAGAIMMGTSGQAAIDEAQRMKDEADLAAAKSDEERNAILARIEEGRRRAEEAVRRSPYRFASGGVAYADSSKIGEIPQGDGLIARLMRENPEITKQVLYKGESAPSLISAGIPEAKVEDVLAALTKSKSDSEKNALFSLAKNPYMFAYGGSVDDEAGTDDLSAGGIASMAKGGMAPRFLSGGGDGMSDDIPATINNKQPARLADGEFVIPADVVSHLGNGSSKAGAKRLYSMMDRVRKARTGTTKQGREINPAKYMPA